MARRDNSTSGGTGEPDVDVAGRLGWTGPKSPINTIRYGGRALTPNEVNAMLDIIKEIQASGDRPEADA